MRVNNDVLAVLSRAETKGDSLFLCGMLGRNMYTQVNKVLEAAGGKWNRKAKAHIFDGDAATRIDQIIMTGEVDVPKDDFNFFETPPPVVERLLELAGIEPGMRVLEPSAGKGAIAFPCAEAGGDVDCIESMKALYEFLMNHPRRKALGIIEHQDFLRVEPLNIYDRVVMNPPFMKQSDITHVLHALQFLRRGGLLVAVMSAGVAFRENRKTVDFRNIVCAHEGLIEPMAPGAFKSSGTMVSTVIVTIPA